MDLIRSQMTFINLQFSEQKEKKIQLKWRQLNLLNCAYDQYSSHTGTTGMGPQYLTFTSVHMRIRVVMLISANVCSGVKLFGIQ